MARALLFRVSRFDLNQPTINLDQLKGADVCVRLWYFLCPVFGKRDECLVLVDTVTDGMGPVESASS